MPLTSAPSAPPPFFFPQRCPPSVGTVELALELAANLSQG